MIIAKMKSSTFKMVVDAMSEIVDSVLMYFGEEEVKIQAMDSSHVSLCFLQLQGTGFTEYVCETPENVGVSLSNLSKILKCTSADDEMEIRIQDSDKMGLRFKGPERSSEFEMKLMDIDSDYLHIPDVEYECVVDMPSSDFHKLVRNVAVVGDTCTVDVKNGGMIFSSEGDIGQATFHALEKETMKISGTTMCKFANKYLQMFTKATPLCPRVVLKISTDNPMCLEYGIEDRGVLKYYLAPKIEDDSME